MAQGPKSRLSAYLFVIGAALFLAACTTTETFEAAGKVQAPPGGGTILVMPVDVTLYEVSAGGLLEPNAAWTETARGNVLSSIDRQLAGRGLNTTNYPESMGDLEADIDNPEVQLAKLHAAVGRSILRHKLVPQQSLPTKRNVFDWSLGERATALRSAYDADYALFLHARDSFSSAGRVAVKIIGALFGAPVQGGRQEGFASLVDLRTGNLVWFNVMRSTSGDMRESASADNSVEDLLDDFPL